VLLASVVDNILFERGFLKWALEASPPFSFHTPKVEAANRDRPDEILSSALTTIDGR